MSKAGKRDKYLDELNEIEGSNTKQKVASDPNPEENKSL
jgi:hypothetical protein